MNFTLWSILFMKFTLPFADFAPLHGQLLCALLLHLRFQLSISQIDNHLTSSFKTAISVTQNLRKIKCYYKLGNESFKKLRDELAPGVSDRGCLCCQSKAEQWLRLISLLINANWHICYGGIAVQTLQLAWLINYPPAGGSMETEAGEQS